MMERVQFWNAGRARVARREQINIFHVLELEVRPRSQLTCNFIFCVCVQCKTEIVFKHRCSILFIFFNKKSEMFWVFLNRAASFAFEHPEGNVVFSAVATKSHCFMLQRGKKSFLGTLTASGAGINISHFQPSLDSILFRRGSVQLSSFSLRL